MKENFDDILKRKWEQKQFPVDEGHRAQMLELLDKKDRKRMFPFWWLGSLVVVAGLSAYFFFQSPQTASQNAPAITSEEPASNAEQTIGQQPVQDDQAQTLVNQPSNNETANEYSATAISTTDSSDPLTYKPVAETGQTSSVKSATSAGTSTESSASIKSNPTSANPKKANATTPKTKVPTASTATQATKPDQASVTPSEALQRLPNSLENTPVTATVDIVTNQTTEGEEVIAEEMPAAVQDIRTPIDIGPLDMLPAVSLSYVSSLSPGPVVPEVKPHRYLSIFGEAGTGLIMASQPDFSSGWKLRVGAGLAYTPQPRLQWNWSIGYLYQSGGFDFQRSSTVQQASFGARSSFNTLTPDRLHYVYSRIGGLYRFKRHFISMHGGVQYLYGAQGEIVTQTVEQFVPGVQSNTTYDWLVTDGLQQWQWNADVAYGFQLTPRLSFSAGADIFFSPLTRQDDALSQKGYYWKGAYSPVHPFITLNYQIHALR